MSSKILAADHSGNVPSSDGSHITGESIGGFKRALHVINDAHWDYIAVAEPDATTETYTFKVGGALGITTRIITVTYTDSTKATLSTIVRT